MTGTTVSVALCTHNGARFIAEQVASILGQTVPVTQLVISDDASSDDTVDIALNTIERARLGGARFVPSVVVLRNPVALGVTANFEQAIRATVGDFIALCDQDDRWHVDRVEAALAVFSSRPEITLVHSDAVLIDGDGAPMGHTLFDVLGIGPATIGQIHRGDALSLLTRRNLVTGATTMIRRTLLDDSLPFPAAWVHDEWLAIIAAASGGVDVVADPLIDYRQHGGNEIGAVELSLLGKVRRMLEPGSDRNSRLLARAQEVADRFPESSHPVLGPMMQQKLAHEVVRAALPSWRIGRLIPVMREVATGRYGRFGRGIADAARDLLQPL